jgi:outer membrane protein
MSKIFLVFCSLWIASAIFAQEQWSLSSCIDYAYKNNTGLQISKIPVERAAIDLKESKYKMLPDLNARINSGISFGRNVDPTSNAFTTSDIVYSDYSLSTSVLLFQGGFLHHTIKQNKLNLESGYKDYEQAANDLALNIAVYYLNVLQSQERLHIAEKNKGLVQSQLDQINKLIKAGVKPEADALEVQSQYARSEQTFVVAENALALAWLTLKQALRLDPSFKMSLEPLSDEQFNSIQLQKYSFEDLFSQASENKPGIQSAKIKLEAAKTGEKIAHALYYPSIYLNGIINSRYSDAARTLVETNTKERLEGKVFDTIPFVFEYDAPGFEYGPVVPFSKQFDQFLGYGAAISINIPIFNNYSTRAKVQQSKLITRQSELQLELQKEKLGQDIYQALTNVNAAIKELEAAKNAWIFSKSSFEKTQKRFEIGATNIFELNQIQTNFLNAETTYLISKYDLVFKQKILDYYAGKELKM